MAPIQGLVEESEGPVTDLAKSPRVKGIKDHLEPALPHETETRDSLKLAAYYEARAEAEDTGALWSVDVSMQDLTITPGGTDVAPPAGINGPRPPKHPQYDPKLIEFLDPKRPPKQQGTSTAQDPTSSAPMPPAAQHGTPTGGQGATSSGGLPWGPHTSNPDPVLTEWVNPKPAQQHQGAAVTAGPAATNAARGGTRGARGGASRASWNGSWGGRGGAGSTGRGGASSGPAVSSSSRDGRGGPRGGGTGTHGSGSSMLGKRRWDESR